MLKYVLWLHSGLIRVCTNISLVFYYAKTVGLGLSTCTKVASFVCHSHHTFHNAENQISTTIEFLLCSRTIKNIIVTDKYIIPHFHYYLLLCNVM